MSDDDRLLEALGRALTDDGELLPTEEDEVARAEADLEADPEVELPAHLAALTRDEEPEAEAPTDLAAYRRERERGLSPVVTHGLTAVLGAAAAGALLLLQTPAPTPGTGPTAEPLPTATSTTTPAPVKLSLASCSDCCGGEDCGANEDDDLARCASGRACVPCDVSKPSLYRLRVSTIAPSEAGEQVLRDYPQGKPELCVRAGFTEETCISTRLEARNSDTWQQLPIAVSREQLGAKLSLRVRWKGVSEPKATAARWSQVVGVTPRALCRGYPVRLTTDDGKAFGQLSLFIDDAHFVELARASAPADLREHAARFALDGVDVAVQETNRPDQGRFVLTSGPYDKPTAEKLRWQLLEQKQPGTVSIGLDYVGAPNPLP